MAEWLSAAELASMRATGTASLPGTCTLRSRTAVADGQGGETWTWADGAVLACRIAPFSRREDAREGRLASVSIWQLLLPQGTSITPLMRVAIDGVEYEVTDVEPPRQEAIFCEATVVRVG